jgi:hypothetical protein
MSEKLKTTLWWILVVGGLTALLTHGTVRADRRLPEPRVGYVCVAGLAVQLVRDARYDGRPGRSLDWPGILPVERCRLPLLPEGLPGEHLLSAITVDGGGGVSSSMVPGNRAEALERAVDHLSGQGWAQSPASATARSRNGSLDLAVMTRPGGVLHVAAVEGDGESSMIVAAGLFEPGAEGGAR